MLTRALTMFVILVIAMVATISAAHAARMDNMQMDRTAHLGVMMDVSSDGQPSCDGGQQCGSVDTEVCAFVCAGPAFLTMPVVEAGHAFKLPDHDFPAEAIHAGHAPGLNERPPKNRLL